MSLRPREPERRQPGEHAALVGDLGRQDDVERRDAVARDEQQPLVVEREDLAHLAAAEVDCGLRHGRSPSRRVSAARRSKRTSTCRRASSRSNAAASRLGVEPAGDLRVGLDERRGSRAPRPTPASRCAARAGTPRRARGPPRRARAARAALKTSPCDASRLRRIRSGVDDEAVDEPREAVEHVVEREERVREDDPLGATSARCRARARARRSRARRPPPRARRARARRSARRPSGCACAASPTSPSARVANGSCDLAHLGAGEVADLGREALERRRARARASRAAPRAGRAGSTCVATGSGSSPSRSQATRSTSGSTAAYVPTAPDELADAHSPRARARAARGRGRARTPSRRASRRTWSARRGRRACGRRRSCARCSSRAAHDGGERAVEPVEDERAGLAHLERERGVDDVRRGEPVVEPAALRARAARRPRRRRRPGRGACRSSISATRSGVGGTACARIAATSSAGTTPTSAQPSSAASSTSSQRASFPRPTRSPAWPDGSSARITRVDSSVRSYGPPVST